MLKDITLGQYYPSASPIHELDPRVKITFTFLFMISLFFVNKFYPYGLITIFLLIISKISKIPFKYLLKGVKPIWPLLAITFLINALMGTGREIYSFHFIKITDNGLRTGTFMVIRLLLLVTGTSLMTLTTKPMELTDGLEKMLSPFKKMGLPAHEIAMMMTIALRFIPTLLDETDKIMKAQMARGADFESGKITERAKSLIPLLVPLFISAFRRADELAMAMESRCYRGGEGRTHMNEISFSHKDIVILIFSTLILILISSTAYFTFGI